MKPWIPWYLFYNSFELFSFSLSFIGSMERKLLDYRFDDTNKVYSMLSSFFEETMALKMHFRL